VQTMGGGQQGKGRVRDRRFNTGDGLHGQGRRVVER
jgi:hypothetical protein